MSYQLEKERKGKELDELVTAHRPHADASDVEFLVHAMRAQVMLKKTDEARQILRTLVQNNKNGTSEYYDYAFLTAMVNADLTLQGYRTAVDKPKAFDIVANILVNRKKDKDLAALLEEHGREYSKTPQYQRCLGELQLLRKDSKAAERTFTAALAGDPGIYREQFRYGLLRAHVQNGQAVQAYRTAILARRPSKHSRPSAWTLVMPTNSRLSSMSIVLTTRMTQTWSIAAWCLPRSKETTRACCFCWPKIGSYWHALATVPIALPIASGHWCV